MAVGQNALFSGFSYLAVGRETTFGTYDTCTASLPMLSMSLKTIKDNKMLEEIDRSRTYVKRIGLGKVVEGSCEFYAAPEAPAFGYLLQTAFGGTVTSATAAGDTTGASAIEHVFAVGALDQSYSSLCLNLRKGPSGTGKVFQYSGVRVDTLSFTAELDEALKVSAALVCKDSTVTSNDVESALTVTTYNCLSFADGRVSVESSFASLTSTSFWHVQSVSFEMANSLKKDTESRRIGSDVLDVLPSGILTNTLTMTVRFDTTTAFDAMIAGTTLSAQLVFQGPTISGSTLREELKINFPRIYVKEAGDPEIGGPDEILTSEITFDVARDASSATGYAVQATLRNSIASFA